MSRRDGDASPPAFPKTEALGRTDGVTTHVPLLKVTSGKARGSALRMDRTRATVGRHPTNDLVLPDPRVSSVHLELERRDQGSLYVRDPGSTNGTFVAGVRIVEGELTPGASLQVGDCTLQLQLDQVTEPAPLPHVTPVAGMIGDSPQMQEFFSLLARISQKSLGVVLQGETGTGKEEAARALHAQSPRKGGPFVVLDATSIPHGLAESILFGHEKGSFTGAEQRHLGAFERAHGGTLFIDEVGELPEALQPKLLRVLERHELCRVGGKETLTVDVRVVAATHRDLRREVELGRFREDLYYRLAQARLVLPPLRARAHDIPLLVAHFLQQASRAGEPVPRMSDEVLAELCTRPFPGNVRELRNVVLRAAALCEDNVVALSDIAGEGYGMRPGEAESDFHDLSGTFADAKSRALSRFEIAYLKALLRRSKGNLSLASREADLARNHLRDLLKKRSLYEG